MLSAVSLLLVVHSQEQHCCCPAEQYMFKASGRLQPTCTTPDMLSTWHIR